MAYMDYFKQLNEGVREEDNQFIIDMSYDKKSDFIKTIESDCFYKDEIDNSIFYFGYKFDYSYINSLPNINDRKVEIDKINRFISWFKQQKTLTDDIENFICRPLNRLKQDEGFGDFDIIVYPESRGNIGQLICECLAHISFRHTRKKSIQFIKQLPDRVSIDWDAVELASKDISHFRMLKKNITEILRQVNNKDYFSIGEIPKKYRNYFTGFLDVEEDKKAVIKSIIKGNILIVDDVNTSNATLPDCIRVIKQINHECNIYIFTLFSRK